MNITVQNALADAMLTLFDASSSPEIDAEVLLGHSLKQSRAWLLTYQEEELSKEQITEFQTLVNRRKNGEPIAYILGEREFWSLNLNVNSSTLIPRPETEVLVEVALEKAQLPFRGILSIADLGTGSGAIALALATELENAFITATDKSDDALAVAKQNAEQLGLSNVEFLNSDWFNNLSDHRFNIICSNPPYIENRDPHLQQGDLRFEPQSALASGPDGLFDIQHIISQAQHFLHVDGWLILEHGFQQVEQAHTLFTEASFVNINTRKDYAGHPRITYGQKPLIPVI